MNGNSIYERKDFSLANDGLMLNETIFHNANGYIGVRANLEEGYPEGFDTIRGSYINGFYDFAEMKQAEKLCGLCEEKQTMLNVVDTQGIRLMLGDETFSMFEGTVEESRRYLDMAAGISGRQVVWCSPGGRRVEIHIRRMASFVQLSLFTIEYMVKALNFSGDVTFLSTHIGDVKNYCNPNDPRVAGESFEHLVPVSAEITDDISYLVTNTARSGLTVCTAVKHALESAVLSAGREISYHVEGHRTAAELKTQIQEGETVTLVKYTVFADSVRCGDCRDSAAEEMKKALETPLIKHYEAQRNYLNSFWDQSSLEIEGDDALSVALKYNTYQLLQSVGKDEYSNIAAKGLSGEGYEGHYFWDTEMYMQPFFTLTNPKLSRNLVAYRYSTLDAARENARILGHKKGALYPWRTIMGKECSGYFPSGSAQYHIDGDIAYSVVAYYLATKDLDFISDKGAEIVFETARLWMDVGNYCEGQFRINDVTGPDEYTCIVNNNYFTNASAQYNLHWAVRFYHLLQEAGKPMAAQKIGLTREEVAEFEKAEKHMYLPYDEKTGINPQDDSFLKKEMWDFAHTPGEHYPLLLHYHPLYIYRFQVCKQADTVLAHFIYEDAQDIETIRRSFDYYEKVTTHDSSLSTCIFSIVASKLGLEDKAYAYFGDSAKLDLFNLHHNTKDGIHTANMGGNYMSVVYGFGGFRLKESGIYFAPALPKQWSGYRFKILYEDSQIQVEVRAGESSFSLVKGSPKIIHVYGEPYELKDVLKVAERKVVSV